MSEIILKIMTNVMDFADAAFSSPHSPSIKDRIESMKFQVQTKVANIFGLAPPVPSGSPPISQPLGDAPKLTQQTTINPVTGKRPEQKELIVDMGYNTQVPYPVRSGNWSGASPKTVEEHSFLRNANSPLNHDRNKLVFPHA
jgi:hypothetical protein